MPSIIVVGGSDTGRAPIAAALLRAKLRARGLEWDVSSAGVVGHDGSPAQTEARDTAAHFGVSVDGHAARSLTAELAGVDLLLAVDSGTARVARARFADAAVQALPELVRNARDVPDPFRMQIGAWIAYIKELDGQLAAALPAVIARLSGSEQQVVEAALPPAAEPTQPASSDAPATPTETAADRLLALAAEWPDAIRWEVARGRIAAELDGTARSGLAEAHVSILRALLAMLPDAPSTGQIAALRAELARTRSPVDHTDIARVSALVGRWPLV